MSHTANKPTAAALLHEAQNYRTSLESLMSVGRALLTGPSLEDASATAFQVLAENVLEQADHQQDLVAVDGVDEAQAKVELIMQDVLTPRLTEVEEIEEALQAKADAEEPVPFHTSEHATHASQEELILSMEMLAIHRNYIGAIRQAISLESFPIEAAQPLMNSIRRCFGSYAVAMGVSMESMEQTQVLGDMSNAVERIEQLVSKAHETVLEQAETIRSEAAAVGSDVADKLGDLIEKHRQDNPVGIQFDEGTAVNSVDSGNEDGNQGDTEEETDLDGETGVEEETDLNTDDTSLTAEEQELVPNEEEQPEEEELQEEPEQEEEQEEEELQDDGSDIDLTGVPEENFEEEESSDGEEELDLNDTPEENLEEEPEVEEQEEEETDELDNAEEEEANADTIDVEEETPDEELDEPEGTVVDLEGEEGSEEEQEEEEEDADNASTESLTEPLVWDADVYGEQAGEVRGIHSQLLNFLGDHDLLTPEGQAIVNSDQTVDFVFSSDLLQPRAAEVLARHYDTWISASLRDGEANLLALGILLGL